MLMGTVEWRAAELLGWAVCRSGAPMLDLNTMAGPSPGSSLVRLRSYIRREVFLIQPPVPVFFVFFPTISRPANSSSHSSIASFTSPSDTDFRKTTSLNRQNEGHSPRRRPRRHRLRSGPVQHPRVCPDLSHRCHHPGRPVPGH